MKKTLIHWLGGVTTDEAAESNVHCHNEGIKQGRTQGRRECAHGTLDYAHYLHGRPADEWCHMMYQHLVTINEEME